MPYFNPYEKVIIDLLNRYRKPMSTLKVAERTGIAWETARDHLENLFKKGHIKKKTKSNKIIWWI